MSTPRVAIIGAGVTGLTTAWALQRADAEVTVLERRPRPGGAVRTVHESGFLVEEGPTSLQVRTAAVQRFLEESGLESEAVEAGTVSKKRYLIRKGRPVALPGSPFEALANPLWSPLAKMRLLKELWTKPAPPETEESLADFVRRRLGREFLDYAVQPFVSGIYAGDPERLSVREAFPRLWKLEQEHGSLLRGSLPVMRARKAAGLRTRLLSFPHGLETLTGRLAGALGPVLRTGARLSSIQRDRRGWTLAWEEAAGVRREGFDALVVTVPAHRLAALPWKDAALREGLAPFGDIVHPPLATVALGFREGQVQHPLDGFGALVPEAEQRYLLGALFSSSLFEGRAPRGCVLFSTFVGGRLHPERAREDEDTLVERVWDDLAGLFGLRGGPVYVHLRRWDHSIPQYELGHGAHLARAQKLEGEHPGLHLAGNYRGGVSLGQCIEYALGLALRLSPG